MKIAIVGIDKRVEEIQKITSLMDLSFNLIPFSFSDYSKASQTVKEIENVDGILFVGSYSYYLTKSEHQSSIPTTFFEFDETGIMKLITSSSLQNVPKIISIDTVKSSVIQQIYRELGFPLTHVNSIFHDKILTVEDIVNFHIENYRLNNKTTIITGFFSVYKYLKKNNYPCMLINHTYFSVQKGCDKIIESINFMNFSRNHPAVVIIKIDKDNSPNERNEFKYQRFIYRYFNYMLDFQEKLQSFVFNRGSENYYLISTRGFIEDYTDKYRCFPLLYHLFVKFKVTVSIGIGYGSSPISAMSNAKQALELASKQTNTVKILTQLGQIISPADTKDSGYNIKNFDEQIIQIADDSGVTPENISKIKGILERQNSQHMTAYELSEALGITPRSGNRLLTKLFQAGYAKESRVERPAKGRPSRVYEINLVNR
ncbi:hypothetical protein SAMN05660420_01748 [Desulfuromusa kysingii]|uniref:Transcriptional regulator n=1 Tax=Desulfuromusa kysingii TaxID=37625 RepID=A0A1H4A1P2_9BACT|nr:hypothetical protein [Desulfuromusa kysingii]SEA29374.1 hypothetical protein SAMN05660420_01748 [Desulfuromusa kysingii]